MTKTQKYDIKHDLIIDKGMEVLWSKGYNGTSVNDIVKAVDIPKGSFYFYFDSKEDFVLKALTHYGDTMIKPSLEVLHHSASSPKQRLLNFYDFRLEMLKESESCIHGCLACNIGAEMAEHNEKIRKMILDLHNSVKQEIIEVAFEAQNAGEIKPWINVPSFVEFIENAGKGAMMSMKESQSLEPVENVIKMMKTFLEK